MKKAATVALLLSIFFTAAAQKKQIDFMRLKLSRAKTDTVRYGTLLHLSAADQLSNPDSYIIFAQQGYLLGTKNNWVVNLKKCLNNMAIGYAVLGDYVKDEGTGSGSSLSYDIFVKGHNGTLDIISKEGEGSEFIIKLSLN